MNARPKAEITKLKDAREQTAQTIAALRAAEQESRDPVPSTYWYSDPVAVSVGIESQSEREGIVPLPRPPPPPARSSAKTPSRTPARDWPSATAGLSLMAASTMAGQPAGRRLREFT